MVAGNVAEVKVKALKPVVIKGQAREVNEEVEGVALGDARLLQHSGRAVIVDLEEVELLAPVGSVAETYEMETETFVQTNTHKDDVIIAPVGTGAEAAKKAAATKKASTPILAADKQAAV